MAEKSVLKEMVCDVLPERMPAIPEDQLNDKQRTVIAALVASRGNVRGSFVALIRCPELMERVHGIY